MFLPDRYIKGECPKCDAKDQYGDDCEVCGSVYAPTDLMNPYSALSGATPVLKSSEHFFFRLSDPRCVEFLRDWTRRRARCRPRWPTRRTNGWTAKATRPGRLGHLARRALLRHPDSRCAGQVLLRLAGRARRLPGASFENTTARQQGIDFDAFLADPDTEQIHFIGKDIIYFHTLFWPAMLQFAGYKVPDHVFVHGFLTVSRREDVQEPRHRHQPAALPRLGHEPGVAALLHRGQAQRHVEDIDFNPDDFIARVNSDLVGKYVNIASRARRLHRQALRRTPASAGADGGAARDPACATGPVRDYYEAREYGKALREVMLPADVANQYVDRKSPGNLPSTAPARIICTRCVPRRSTCSACSRVYLKPVLPALAADVERFLGVAPLQWADAGSSCRRTMLSATIDT